MTSIKDAAVEYPVRTALIALLAVALGIAAIELSKPNAPHITIVTCYGGVGADDVESLVTQPVVRTVARVSGVKDIDASSTAGQSQVHLHLVEGVDLTVAIHDVRTQLVVRSPVLPDDADLPQVFRYGSGHEGCR